MSERAVRKQIIGASASNKHVFAVKTFRKVDTFVSRLHLHASASELKNGVDEVKEDLEVHSVDCVKLKSRY